MSQKLNFKRKVELDDYYRRKYYSFFVRIPPKIALTLKLAEGDLVYIRINKVDQQQVEQYQRLQLSELPTSHKIYGLR